MSDLVTALLVALLLVLAYLLWKKEGPGLKGGFAGHPRNSWPGPTLTFPRGEVWPYPSYY